MSDGLYTEIGKTLVDYATCNHDTQTLGIQTESNGDDPVLPPILKCGGCDYQFSALETNRYLVSLLANKASVDLEEVRNHVDDVARAAVVGLARIRQLAITKGSFRDELLSVWQHGYYVRGEQIVKEFFELIGFWH